jgi:hypothetical protein
MKVLVKGSELTNADINFISLVKRGANRSPFKVIKADDDPDTSIVGAVKGLFRMSEPDPTVVAVFVKKENYDTVKEHLEKSGFNIKDASESDDVVLVKQEGFADCKQALMLQLSPNVVMAIGNIAKHAETFNGSMEFDSEVKQTGFYPGISKSTDALRDTLFAIATDEVNKTDISGRMQMACDACGKYLSEISKALPPEVWKFESLRRGVGSSTVAEVDKTDGAATNGGVKGGIQDLARKQADPNFRAPDESDALSKKDGNMDKSKTGDGKDDNWDDDADCVKKNALIAKRDAAVVALNKAHTDLIVAGATVKKDSKPADDDGVKKAQAVVKTATADLAAVNETITKRDVIMKGKGGIPVGKPTMTEEQAQDAALTYTTGPKSDEAANAELQHTGAGGLKKTEVNNEIKEMLEGIAKSVGDLSTAVKAQGVELTKTGERIAVVEKAAATAIQKADNTSIHIGTNYDSAYEALGGGVRKGDGSQPIRKSAEDIWKDGSPLGVIERHAQTVGSSE